MTNKEKEKEAIKALKWLVEHAKGEGLNHVDCVSVEALDVAITSLEEIPEYPFYAEAYQTGYEEAKKEFERPQGEWIEFARWVAKEVLDNYFEESSGAFAEIACRKLVKLGLVEVKDNVYKMKGSEEK